MDWNAPDPQELLAKIEGLRLDNRGLFKQRPVMVRAFWPEARLLGPGTLVGNDGRGYWTLRTDFALDLGMGLTIGQTLEELETAVHYLCEVISCRRGLRPEDHGRSVFISHLRRRRADTRDQSLTPSR